MEESSHNFSLTKSKGEMLSKNSMAIISKYLKEAP
jgi:hypothetical protein